MRTPIPTQPMEISPEEILYYRQEIKSAEERQKKEFVERIGYAELIKYLEAIQCADEAKLSQIAILDEYSPAILSVARSIYWKHPTVNVTAGNPKSEGMVQPPLEYIMMNPDFVPFRRTDLMSGAVSYAMDKSGMKEEMQLTAIDLLVAGFCVVEANHSTTSGEISPVETQSQEGGNPLDKLIGGAKDLFNKVKEGFSKDETADKVAEETDDLYTSKIDSTFVKRWSPLNILFDSEAETFKESRHIIKKIRKSVAQFNAIYPKHKGKIGLSDSFLSDLPFKSNSMSIENRKGVTLYEIEIKKKQGPNCVLVLVNGMNEACDYYQKPFETDDFSIKYGCIDKYGRIYPMSRAKKAKKAQDDINHYLTIQFEHLDRAMRKIGVWMEGLSASGKSSLKNGDPYAFVEKNSPQAVFETLPAPQVLPENKEVIGLMRESINKTIGTNEIAKSGKSDNELLGQDMLENQAFQSSVSDLQDSIGDVANQIINTLKDIIQQLWDDTDYFQITGIQGGTFWYDPAMGPIADLAIGDYGVKTDIMSAMRPDPMKDRQDSMALSSYLLSPDVQTYLQIRGKSTNLAPIENVIKMFNQNPEVMIQDIQADDPMNAITQPQPMPIPAEEPKGEADAAILP